MTLRSSAVIGAALDGLITSVIPDPFYVWRFAVAGPSARVATPI
jgi:hypothetical protein